MKTSSNSKGANVEDDIDGYLLPDLNTYPSLEDLCWDEDDETNTIFYDIKSLNDNDALGEIFAEFEDELFEGEEFVTTDTVLSDPPHNDDKFSHINNEHILLSDSHMVETDDVQPFDEDFGWTEDAPFGGEEEIHTEITPFAKPPSPPNESTGSKICPDVTSYFLTNEVFPSRGRLIEWCQAQGRKANVVVIITKSDVAKRSRKARLSLGCERGGTFRCHHKKKTTREIEALESQRVFKMEKRTQDGLNGLRNQKTDPRQSGTRKCGCPFRLKGIHLGSDSWKLQVTCGLHNHQLALTLVGHPYLGRLNPQEKELVVDMTLSGSRPREVLTTIKRRDPNNVTTIRTVYNHKQKARLCDMEGRSGIQQLLKHLTENNYVHWYRKSLDETTMQDIFWAHSRSIHLAKCFPSVLLLDCTYRTNRYNMPLLQICGTTSTGNTFCVAFAFISDEKEASYVWALSKLKVLFEPHALPQVFVMDRELALINGIQQVFPEAAHMLCSFHIAKNIEAKIRQKGSPLPTHLWKIFLNNWIQLAHSPSEVEFDLGWNSFVSTWSTYPTIVDYLVTYWMPYKEKFVYAWTNMIKHRGNNTTNRVEGQHANLKKHIDVSTGTFFTVWVRMHNMLKGQLTKIEESFENSLTNVKHAESSELLVNLRGYVSHFALKKLIEEIARVEYLSGNDVECDHLL